jgi:hypothetical protein
VATVELERRDEKTPVGIVVIENSDPCKTKNCGSGLARDGDLTVDDDVAWQSVIAGKPAPTGSLLFCRP